MENKSHEARCRDAAIAALTILETQGHMTLPLGFGSQWREMLINKLANKNAEIFPEAKQGKTDECPRCGHPWKFGNFQPDECGFHGCGCKHEWHIPAASVDLHATKEVRSISERHYEALYAEARESLCSCNLVDLTAEEGGPYNVTCDWCERHPGGGEAPPIIKQMWAWQEKAEKLQAELDKAHAVDQNAEQREGLSCPICARPMPTKIKLLRRVYGDLPIGTGFAESGIHDIAEMNAQGAISVRDNRGELLGIKPSEFEWVIDTESEQREYEKKFGPRPQLGLLSLQFPVAMWDARREGWMARAQQGKDGK